MAQLTPRGGGGGRFAVSDRCHFATSSSPQNDNQWSAEARWTVGGRHDRNGRKRRDGRRRDRNSRWRRDGRRDGGDAPPSNHHLASPLCHASPSHISHLMLIVASSPQPPTAARRRRRHRRPDIAVAPPTRHRPAPPPCASAPPQRMKPRQRAATYARLQRIRVFPPAPGRPVFLVSAPFSRKTDLQERCGQ